MIEALWITISFAGAVMTGAALIDSRRDAKILRKFNGSVRGVVARATVRRETFRLCSQVALLVVALPIPRELRIAALMTVPGFVLLNTLSDRQMRQTLLHKVEEEVVAEREASQIRMEARLNARADERAVTASDKADARAVVASDEADARALAADARAEDHATAATERAEVVTERAAEIKVTTDETAVEVHDIHDVTVNGQPS